MVKKIGQKGEARGMEVNRSYWDNLKGLLMGLVVIGHFIQVYFEKCGGGITIIAISGLKQTVLRSKTDAMRSERT